jgi:hypothetical protein
MVLLALALAWMILGAMHGIIAYEAVACYDQRSHIGKPQVSNNIN